MGIRSFFARLLHQVANVFHRYPLNPGGIWLSGSLTVFTSRFGSPPLLARPICQAARQFLLPLHMVKDFTFHASKK